MNPTTQQLPGPGRPGKPKANVLLPLPLGEGRGEGQRPAGTVPPKQYDVLRAPIWTATPAPPARAGATDHQRIASRGFRC